MDTLIILKAVVAILALTTVLATALVVASRQLFVAEDPRVGKVQQMLPHTNCGACGYPGCRAFAEALVAGDVLPGKCSVSSPEGHQQIADYLGVGVGAQERRVAKLACAGGSNVARQQARYEGVNSCSAAALVAGGGKSCFWGCLGLADCYHACDFDAITMNSHHLPVVNEDCCTACGDCVEACPKDLFSLQPISRQLWVACSSLAHGDEVLEQCEVACTACGRCAADAPNVIEMKNNLPIIDDRRPLTPEPTQRCPTGAIVWFNEDGVAVKGEAARQVVRQGDIRNLPT